VVPLLILLPKLTDLRSGLPDMGWALLRAAIFLTLMVLVGTRVIPALMRRVSYWNSRELFLLTVIGLGLGIGYATYKVGLSFALGSYRGRLVISESDHAHQALSDVIPLRDIFGLLFFVPVGMLLEPPFVPRATAPVYGAMKRRRRDKPVLTINIERDELHDHVVVVGLGRMGRVMAGVLKRLELPFVALELDHHRLESCRDVGLAMIFAHASYPVLLEATVWSKHVWCWSPPRLRR